MDYEKQEIQLSDHFDYRRLLRFTIPTIAMMVFTSLYGVADGFFVSNLAGKTDFAAVNLIFPFLMLVGTVGYMFGTGGSAVVAKAYGEGDKERANRYFTLLVAVCAGLSTVLAVIGLIFLRPISEMLGAEGVLLERCITYGIPMLIAMPAANLQYMFHTFMSTAEKPELGFRIGLASGVTNIVLDAILISMLPEDYKVLGAGIATGLGQVIGGIVPVIYFMRENTSLFRLGRFKWEGQVVVKTLVNGSSEFMSNITMTLMGVLYNLQLLKYAGEDGVAAFGVITYVSYAFASVFIGFNIGFGPIISFNDGAGNTAELQNVFRRCIVLISATSVFIVVLGELLATGIARLYVGYDAELMAMTVRSFRIYMLSYFFVGLAMFGSDLFTALNNGVISAIIAFVRTLLFEMTAIIFLPMLFGIDGVWFSEIIAEIMSVVLAVVFIVKYRKRYRYY